jgi:hypothetical protein
VNVIEQRLRGIAANATRCGACQMGTEFADDALKVLDRFEIMLVCKRCGEIADPETHACTGCRTCGDD